ncbi:Serine/threonine-protein phosphatase 6 regulatory ankyrin repeat subunit C [Spatholobus suberectus]|nr:Serine/threonine-protein phosphatase 6 regulatory ankyrin repeat subunit C [Spatholobus suberectus]
MPPSQFPLRWESTGDKWWYASPIDYAAANGLYDLVTELLHLDTNLLIKLTSLRRIRRLETVWDDESKFEDVAKCRAKVARNLMLECETGRGHNSLIRAGYGGWLLYTAASAGDVDFVLELLGRDPLLVFGEGEYGVTDMLYAAARGKNCEVFKLLLHSALSRKECLVGSEAELEEKLDEGAKVFKRDVVNRAIHAAARGGNWEILKQLLAGVSRILSYRDAQGCTVLHAAAARGQVEVVRNLIVSYDIINSTDDKGNTALHVASYRGYLPVVEILIGASPSLTTLANQYGDTFLHMAVVGFRSPGFCRLDKHIELMKQLTSEKIVNMKDIINVRNNDGRTALHVAVIHNIQCDVVELLMSVPSIDLNIHDADGMTPLDHLRQRSRSTSSEILIKQLISGGGISNCQDYVTRNALVNHLKTHGIGGSPGTSFRIPDAEILLYTGIENSCDANYDQASVESNSWSSEINNYDSANSPCNSKSSSVNYGARRLKFLLQWPRKADTKEAASELEDDDSVNSFSSRNNLEDFPIPLRQRYSKMCSLPNNKRTLSIRTYLPSPSAKKYFTQGLMQGVIKVKPQVPLPVHSTSSLFQELSISSHCSNNKQTRVDIMGPSCSNRPMDDGGTRKMNYKQGSFNKTLMNRYFSFGAHGQAVEDANSCTMSNHSSKHFSSLVA